ncbi:polyamine ABC transporter substrate-binding protein [Vibrio aquaticus]|nr:spermidine/putrescine ABC transporter substrate-binding protein [Vibrio aquaticus]
MKTSKSLSLLAIIASLPCFSVAQDTLHLYMWEDSLADKVVEQWNEQQTYQLQQSFFDNDDERDQLMLDGEKLPFDIITFDNVSAQYYGEQGQLVDVSDLSNRNNNGQRWNQACGDYAVPYFWGMLGLAYRKSQFPTPPNSWRAITQPKPSIKGHIGLLSDTVETLFPALLTLGFAGNTNSTGELKLAYQYTLSMLNDILTFDYAISYVRTSDTPKDLYIAMAYSGDQFALNNFFDEGDWDFAIPQEGSSIWVDCLAINAHSSKVKQAKQFLNYIMDAQVAALNAEYIQVATPNEKAHEYLSAEYLNNSTLFPRKGTLQNSYIDSRLSGSSNTLRTKIIKTILSKHETQH